MRRGVGSPGISAEAIEPSSTTFHNTKSDAMVWNETPLQRAVTAESHPAADRFDTEYDVVVLGAGAAG